MDINLLQMNFLKKKQQENILLLTIDGEEKINYYLK